MKGLKQISYKLAYRTTAVLLEARTDLLPEAAGFGQQICSRVKQKSSISMKLAYEKQTKQYV